MKIGAIIYEVPNGGLFFNRTITLLNNQIYCLEITTMTNKAIVQSFQLDEFFLPTET
jgi:hypothetical protein